MSLSHDRFRAELFHYFELTDVPSGRRHDLADLGFDSLMLYECCLFIEELAGHDLVSEALDQVRTVEDLYGLYLQAASAADA